MPPKQDEAHVPVHESKKPKAATAITPWRSETYLSDFDRAFDELARGFGAPFGSLPSSWIGPRRGWLQGLTGVRFASTDLIDSGNEYRVLAEVPGIPKEKLDVTVTENEIRIEGEARADLKEDKEGYVRRERAYSKVSRRLSFPESVLAEKAVANLKDGVLEVRVPKKTPTKLTRHKVAVK